MKLKFNAAGLKYSSFGVVKRKIIPGTEIKLEFEPENQYDSNAVRLEYFGEFVGYVPSDLTLEDAIINERPFVVNKVGDDTLEIVQFA